MTKEASPGHTWHAETQTWVLFTSHQVFSSTILFGSSCKISSPYCHLQKSLQNQMAIWHRAVPRCDFYFSQFTKHGDYASTHNPTCCGSVELSVVRFHHIPPICLFLKTKPPSLLLTLFHPTVFEILKKKKTWSNFLIMPLFKMTKITVESTSITALRGTHLSRSREEQDCSSVQSCASGRSSMGNGIPQKTPLET